MVQAPHKHERTGIQMPEENKEFQRIKYSLKMALRMINGSFTSFQVSQFGNSGNMMEDDHDKTTIESWYRSEVG